MALVVKDRVQETSTTTGTGTLTLSGATTGYQTFSSAIGNTNTTYYAIQGGSEWEVGIGTVSAGALSRDTVLESSNGGSLVNLSAGSKFVFCTYPAERSVTTDAIGVSIQAYDADTTKNDVANTFTANQIISVTDNSNAALRVTQLGTGNAILVEDSSNPDSTPFVVDASGNVGVGTSSPDAKLSVSGVASFSDGSAAAPSITNIGDLNTGMFFPAADTIAFAEGGVESMRINSSGNVGIGTSAPDIRLDVTGGNATIRGDGSLAFINLLNTFNAGYFSYSTAAGNAFDMQNVLSGPIRFYTNNTYSAAISSTGDLLFNSGYGSVATAYGCRAWANFTGSGSAVLIGGGNISSVARSGTGNYQVNLSTAMPDTIGAITHGYRAGQNADQASVDWNSSSQIQFSVIQSGSGARDSAENFVAVYR